MSYFPRKFQITKVNRNSVHDLSGVTGIPGCQPTRMSPEEHRKALVLGEDLHAALCPCVCVDDDSEHVVLPWKAIADTLPGFQQERLSSLPCSSATTTS